MKIFITGISRGLGRTIAEECVLRGHDVWGVSRTGAKNLNKKIVHTECDISSYPQVEAVHRAMMNSGFLPDAVIFNAASMKRDRSSVVDADVLDETYRVNCLGHMYWTSLLLPQFLDRPEGGAFLNISSVSALRSTDHEMMGYAASKRAMNMLFEGLRIKHSGSKKIRFITVNLGPIGEVKNIPFLASSYKETAAMLIQHIESPRSRDVFSYPFLTGLVYKTSRLIPNKIIDMLLKTYDEFISRGRSRKTE